MRTLKKVKSISLKMLIWMASISISIISSNAYASVIQDKTVQLGAVEGAKTIFAASCATCHGGKGQGGVTFIKNMPSDKRTAPSLLKKPVTLTKTMVRNGSWNGAMPAFGIQEITDAELNALADLLFASTTEVGAPTVPVGSPVIVNILDADPWYGDGTLGGPHRVALTAGQYVKVVNTGRTWHTFTDPGNSKDSGFIGYAGNYNNVVGDLDQLQAAGIGYYYAGQTDPDGAGPMTAGLTAGCGRYLCKLHPYMQVEVCTSGNTPRGVADAGLVPEAFGGLTRAHKHPIATPAVGGVGNIWVTVQSQEESYETGTATVTNKSVSDMDGAYQVIDSTDWTVERIADVGNNPHNAWPGKNGANEDVVLSANWHDNTVTLMDANFPYTNLGERRSGAATAHIQASPTENGRFYVTHMGGAALQEIDVDELTNGNDPNIGGAIKGNTAPHGLWFCADGVHVLTADTMGNTATLYNTTLKTSVTSEFGSGGKAPLAPSLFGCSRGFTNNALTADISVYNIIDTPGAETIARTTAWTDSPGTPNFLHKNPIVSATNGGNIDLIVLPGDSNYADQRPTGSAGLAESIEQARWVNLPVQTPVSPADSVVDYPISANDGHGRYMVTANKASFNVSVTALDASGNPTATYTFPAGLGAHGVTYAKKNACDDSNGICYYAYVTNTFEDYVSVYDLEKIENGSMGAPGSALVAERVYVEGGAVTAVATLDPRVAGLCDVVDLVGAELQYDLPCGVGPLPTSNCTDPGGDGQAELADYDLNLANGSADVFHCGVGAMNTAARAAVIDAILSGAVADGTPVVPSLAVGHSLYVADLPIGVLCPDCRSGVHVGDIQLTSVGATGAPLGGSPTDVLGSTLGADPDGAASKYTYLKEHVWVDTHTVTCALLGGTKCDAGTGPYGGAPATPGTINTKVQLDLSLGINTGGQGIVASPAATPW